MSQDAQNRPDPHPERTVRRLTWALAGLFVLMFSWYLVADRRTPTTDNARVRSFVQPVASEVSGRLTELLVAENQEVVAGQLLARIESERYHLLVEKAEAAVALAGQAVGADTANVVVAQAELVEAQSEQERVLLETDRLVELGRLGYLAQSDLDSAMTKRVNAKAKVQAARANLESAEQNAGLAGEANPRIRKALATLALAQKDLKDTEIRAPYKGIVTNIRFDVGVLAQAGQPLFTFLSTQEVWLEAYLRENNLTHLQAGDPVELVLDSAPGQIFPGRVVTVSHGIQFGADNVGALPSPPVNDGWLREPQRFPVMIRLKDPEMEIYLREGGQADIIVYTESAGWLSEALGRLWIRLMGLVSYVN
ncbi:HlyD family secretion protein [Ferrimonas balearica]|uniref:HlyD family secretion protein n=1 Tax=Ferrimonas balearica TaxID=44012 RepID=UPI001C9A21FF|nr:HlyD family secretion protein [Ferrimonas balearica]MBY5991144.1 HlyD family secretion protein [Ferrimonas balearica]